MINYVPYRCTERCSRTLRTGSCDWVVEVRWVYINITYICVICKLHAFICWKWYILEYWFDYVILYMTEVLWCKCNVMIYQSTCIYGMRIDVWFHEWYISIESSYRTGHMHILHSFDSVNLKSQSDSHLCNGHLYI